MPLSKLDSLLLVEFKPFFRIRSDFWIVVLHDASSRRLTFDMRGDRQQAKLDVGRPLDGRVGRHLPEARRLFASARGGGLAAGPILRCFTLSGRRSE
jgi:hypothetical protein